MGKSKDTSAAVMAAAISNFSKRGFEGTGVRDIARDAGLTPAALYHYMGSKEDLLVQIMRDGIGRLIEKAETALSEASDSPREQLGTLIDVHVREHCETQVQAQISDYELRSLNEANRRAMTKLRNRYEDLWRGVIDKGVKSKEFTVVDQTVCRLALIQMCTGVTAWYSATGPLSVDELTGAFRAIGLQAVGAKRTAGEVIALTTASAQRSA